MTAHPHLDQIVATARDWRRSPEPAVEAIREVAESFATRALSMLPDLEPQHIGAVLLLAAAAATELAHSRQDGERLGAGLVANVLALTGERLYTGSPS